MCGCVHAMKNLTDCLVVLKSYDTESYRMRFKDFLFRNDVSCRRYCVCFQPKKPPYLYEVSEHPRSFFDRVADTHSGKPLIELYLSCKVDPFPMSDIPPRRVHTQEFCVIYNISYNEYSLIHTIEHGKPEVMTYFSDPIMVFFTDKQ